jgi:hypothetical protein
MKKLTITSVFGIIGILFWTLTILLRGTVVNGIETFNFVLGIMPNIAAAWFFIWTVEIIVNRANKDFTFKTSLISSGLILLFAIMSETIHDLFLNSPFDIYDIIGTILAIVLYLGTLYIIKNYRNTNEQSAPITK